MTYIVPQHVHYRDLHGEVVLLDARSDAYLGLNRSAAVIWSALAGGKSVDEAVNDLVEHYGISADRAREDVEALIGDLEKRGLLAQDGQ